MPARQSPPDDGMPTCQQGTPSEAQAAAEGCWGKCLASDVISAQVKARIGDIVAAVVADFPKYLAVVPITPRLQFDYSLGRYQRALTSRGYSPVYACATDCTALSNVAVDDARYCVDGVDADAVLSVTRPPGIPGVLGTGSYCAAGPDGRPQWLVIAWMKELDMSLSLAAHVEKYRGFVLHELFHSMGFSNAAFMYARDATGRLKNLLQLKEVTDADGATDTVYHFVRGRAYEMAKDYFGCANDSAWEGLPLMGLPELGRGSHFETRVMRDDVLSYGGRAIVSGLTLAAMEDLGFYRANYSAAECMQWGYKQGCAFVTSRCSTMAHDQSATTTSASDCAGSAAWSDASLGVIAEIDKCARGPNPCDTLADRGYSSSGVCDAQCYTPTAGRADCSAAPSSELVEAAAVSGCSEHARALGIGECIPAQWMQFLFIGLWAVGALIVLCVVRDCCCPKHGSKGLALAVVFFVGLVGAAAAAAGVYGLFFDFELLSAYAGRTTLWGLLVGGGAMTLVALVASVAICARSVLLLRTCAIFFVVLLLAEAAATVLVCYYVYQLDAVRANTAATFTGESGGVWSGVLGEEVLRHIEGISCRTYQTCCRDPMLDVPTSTHNSSDAATCLIAHEGSANDVSLSLLDPASSHFCSYVSGSTALANFTVAPSVCAAIEAVVGGFSVDSCQASFCSYGYEGYEEFIGTVVGWMKNNGIIVGGIVAVVVLVQGILIANLWSLSKKDDSKVQDVQMFSRR